MLHLPFHSSALGAIQFFFDAGYKKEQLLEVLIGIGIKAISNYFDHITALEIDDEFKSMIPSQA